VLTTGGHGVYLVDGSLGAIQSHVVIDPGYSVDLGRLAGATFVDNQVLMAVSENKSFVLLESRGPEDERDDYRYFLETSGDLAELRRSRLATMRARMHYVMSVAYDEESDSLFTVSVPNRRHETLVVSRFDRGDLLLSEEFLPDLAPDSGLTLRSSDRSLGELFVTGAAVEERRLYALSAAYSTLLVIDLDRREVVAAFGVEGLDNPTGLAIRGSELYLFNPAGTIAILDRPMLRAQDETPAEDSAAPE
jgi:disulfide bond formation protein DsbB